MQRECSSRLRHQEIESSAANGHSKKKHSKRIAKLGEGVRKVVPMKEQLFTISVAHRKEKKKQRFHQTDQQERGPTRGTAQALSMLLPTQRSKDT